MQRSACVSIISLLLIEFEVNGGAHEERLIDEIFEQRRYNKHARPVLDERDALNIDFGITMQQIIDVVRFHSLSSLTNNNTVDST